jgi:hypothetical protein
MSDEKLDAILKNQEELSRHLLNTQTDVDDLKHQHGLIQRGFQGNVDVQRDISVALAKLDERTHDTKVWAIVACMPVAIAAAAGLWIGALKMFAWMGSPAPLAMLASIF